MKNWISWTSEGHPVADEQEIKGNSMWCPDADRYVQIWEDGYAAGWKEASEYWPAIS